MGADLKVLNRDVIKYIAMVTMLLNHIAHIFLTRGTVLYEVLEDIGFFTAPVMCFFLVEGYEHTRSKKQYGQRLLLFAVISQIPYKLAFGFHNLNMIFTLFCCFMILVAMERITNSALQIIVCMLLLMVTAVSDWGMVAPICTILLYRSRGNPGKTALGYGVVYLLFAFFNIQSYGSGAQRGVHALLSGTGIVVAAVTVLVFYNGKRAGWGRNFSKWFFYLFYPGHLMILYLIKICMKAG